MDLALPFGLRSAPAIFNSVADVVEWILVNNYGIDDLLHYLDDFILAAPATSSICASNLHVAVSVVAKLGLPLHPQKCLGPASCMVVLGIELDTVAQIARLPTDKFSSIQDVLSQWSTRKCCKKKELQSLGTLRSNNADVVKYAVAAWGLCRGRRVRGGKNKLRWRDSATRLLTDRIKRVAKLFYFRTNRNRL